MFKKGIMGMTPVVRRRLVMSQLGEQVPALLHIKAMKPSTRADPTGTRQAPVTKPVQICAVATHLTDTYVQSLVTAVTPRTGRFGQLQSARFWHALLASVALSSSALAAPAWVLGVSWPREELLLNVWPPLLVCVARGHGETWLPALRWFALPAVALSYVLGTALFEVHGYLARATLAFANLVHIALLRCGAPGYLDICRSRVPACSLLGHVAWFGATLVPSMDVGSHGEDALG